MARPVIRLAFVLAAVLALSPSAIAQTSSVSTSGAALSATTGLHPNLVGQVGRPLRYKPVHGDFVIENGTEFFNRSLYGGNTAFRVDGGDKPEFMMYLPGRGGNLRLAIKTKNGAIWLKDAAEIVTRYRPGELIYEIHDKTLGPAASVTVEVLGLYQTEGMIVQVRTKNIAAGAQLIWVYGGVNGARGVRDGDIGTEKVPISEYFQFRPDLSNNNTFRLGNQSFTLKSPVATIVGVVSTSAHQYVADAENWNDLPALLTVPRSTPKLAVVVGLTSIRNERPVFLSLQRVSDSAVPAQDLDVYREVSKPRPGDSAKHETAKLLPAFASSQLSEQFDVTRRYFDALRTRVRITTPDPYLDATVGALNVVGDALWDTSDQAIMHGSIAWRTKLLGWRGPYVLDALGWHDRARQNIETWLPRQNTSTPPAVLPPADPKANLARNEPGLHSNGDISNSHYDMNMVFMDAVFRHLLWTGDADYARKIWPVIQRHLAWERRLFRREYGPDKLPLYEAYATIWASDDLYYSGGGTSYASAYNVYANRMAARIATLAGEDPKPYSQEADLIEQAMRSLLWVPDQGVFAESKDLLGKQLVHDDYGLWTFYHTIDEEVATPREAWEMGEALRSKRRIPVEGQDVPKDQAYHVLSETDWMPYSWSINNVVMDENIHTALALWQSGHADDAYVLTKSALLASMYMGISPGNVGTMNYLDAYRRESQRDFADSAGTLSRAVVEGLFGVHPDALAGTLTIAPGLPAGWTHARLDHPDVGVNFRRTGHFDVWDLRQSGNKFKRVTLRIPAAFSEVESVTADGRKVEWQADQDAVGRPVLEVTAKAGQLTSIRIHWKGEAFTEKVIASAAGDKVDGNFRRTESGSFRWWTMRPKNSAPDAIASHQMDWKTPKTDAVFSTVDLSGVFNDRVTAIFAPGKYQSPRSTGVSLALPSQGVGAWAGHLNLLPVIDDSGLRKAAADHRGKLVMPNQVEFATPSTADARNIAFTSQWDNYPNTLTVPLTGQAKHIYLLMAGSTNFMQSRIDNGEIVVTYTDGSISRLALKNPDTWWPIEQDYSIDDFQFVDNAPLPPRIDLKTGQIRILDPVAFKGAGREVPGGAATALDLALDPAKTLKSLTVRTLANDVVIGLMSATLERP